MNSWQVNWENFIEDLKGIPSEIDDNEIAGSASKEQLVECENRIGINFPPKFREFLLNSSAGIDVGWSLADGVLVKLEGERESISTGSFFFNLDEIYEANIHLQNSYEPDEYELEFHPKDYLGFAYAGNGDKFAVSLSGSEIDSIIYLSHDIENIHMYKVGNDINSFLRNYGRLGFAGPEFWVWQQFTNSRTTPIDCNSQRAIEFINSIKKGRRSVEAEEAYERADEALRKMQYEVYALPKANKYFEVKDFEAFIRVLSEYSDLLSGAVKKKYEYCQKQKKG